MPRGGRKSSAELTHSEALVTSGDGGAAPRHPPDVLAVRGLRFRAFYIDGGSRVYLAIETDLSMETSPWKGGWEDFIFHGSRCHQLN